MCQNCVIKTIKSQVNLDHLPRPQARAVWGPRAQPEGVSQAVLAQLRQNSNCWKQKCQLPAQAVYTVLREAELRSTAPIPYWNVPLLAALDPRQRRVAAALTVINDTLDGLIDRCKQLVRGTAWGQF